MLIEYLNKLVEFSENLWRTTFFQQYFSELNILVVNRIIKSSFMLDVDEVNIYFMFNKKFCQFGMIILATVN